MSQASRITLKAINHKIYEGVCPISQIGGILKKKRKVTKMKENDSEAVSESIEWNCGTGRADHCCEFRRKLDEECIKDFNPCPHRNKLRSKTTSKMFFWREGRDEEWTLAQTRKHVVTYPDCILCNPVS
jgi:hypothetical protein